MKTTMVFLFCYILSYFILSLNGIYRPACIGTNGIKWWHWTPAGYYTEGYNLRLPVLIAYGPLWRIDNALWHNYEAELESKGTFGPRDSHIRINGQLVKMKD